MSENVVHVEVKTTKRIDTSIVISFVMFVIGIVAALFGNVGIPIMCAAAMIFIVMSEVGDDIVRAIEKK